MIGKQKKRENQNVQNKSAAAVLFILSMCLAGSALADIEGTLGNDIKTKDLCYNANENVICYDPNEWAGIDVPLCDCFDTETRMCSIASTNGNTGGDGNLNFTATKAKASIQYGQTRATRAEDPDKADEKENVERSQGTQRNLSSPRRFKRR